MVKRNKQLHHNSRKKRNSHSVDVVVVANESDNDDQWRHRRSKSTQSRRITRAVASSEPEAASPTTEGFIPCTSSGLNNESHRESREQRKDLSGEIVCSGDEHCATSTSEPSPTEATDLERSRCNEEITSRVDSKAINSVLDARENNVRNNRDLESALHRVILMGSGSKESIADDRHLSFRVGHAGDASLLAKLHQLGARAVSRSGTDDKIEPSSDDASSEFILKAEQLEVRLADALGDEDNPPSMYAIIAELSTSDYSDSTDVAAAALLADDCFNDYIRLEWLYLSSSLSPGLSTIVERRLWLRLAAVCMLMSCDIVVDSNDN